MAGLRRLAKRVCRMENGLGGNPESAAPAAGMPNALVIWQVRSGFLVTDSACGNSLPWLRCWGSPVANTVRWRNG